MKKVILIGVDSISWKLIDPFIERGKLPNFARLKKSGFVSTLESTYPPISPPGWVSLFTGYEPIHHHIFDFIKRKKNSYFIEPIFSEDRKKPFVWEYIGKNNKRTIAIGIPFSYPPQPLNGILVSGLGTPSKDSSYTYPKEIKEYIVDHYPEFDVDFEENNLGDTQIDQEYILNKIKRVTESEFLLAKDLYKKEAWDLFCLVFRSTDLIQHYFINNESILEACYQQIDEYIGWFMDNMSQEDTLIVCSDHGGNAVHTRFYINTWLQRNGYLSIKKNDFKLSLLNLDEIETRLLKSPFKNIVWKLKRSQFIEYLLNITQLFASSRLLGDYKKVIWNKTTIYSPPTSTGLLFINQLEREPEGIVSYLNRASILNDLKEKILQLTYKGKKVIREVVIIDDKYPNRSNNDMHIPDCIIILNDGFTMHPGFSTDIDVFVPEQIRIGDHNPEGVLVIFQKGKQKKNNNIKTKVNSIYDITPTILELLNVKNNVKFDGKVIFKRNSD